MMKRIYIILALLSGSLWASDTLFFDVSILGIHVAGVEVIEQQLDGDVNEIIYHAFTVGAFDKIYGIDNWYYYYTDASLSHMDSLKKTIRQKDFHQNYSEIIRNDSIYYHNFHVIPTPKPLHHALSFLLYFQHYPEAMKTGNRFSFLISDEGELYHPEISVTINEKKQQKEIQFFLLKVAGEELVEPTDVFNWMVCSPKVDRMLAYSLIDNTISEGYFTLGWGFKLRAKRTK